MSFIRPEARAQIWRLRELLAAAAILLLGVYWVLGPGGLLGWLGWTLIVAGGFLAIIGIRRLQFRQAGRGPGVVQVDEGQIAYFGPLTGGAVAMSELNRLILDPTSRPAIWILEQPGNAPLHIPVNADGAEALFDAFAALPGLKTTRLLAHLNGSSPMPTVVWEKSSQRPEQLRLH